MAARCPLSLLGVRYVAAHAGVGSASAAARSSPLGPSEQRFEEWLHDALTSLLIDPGYQSA